MRVREFFAFDAADLGFLWKYQLLLGVLLVLIGVCVVLLPGLLEIMVATAIVLVGVSVIGSALRFRRLQRRHHDFSLIEEFEW